MSRKARIKILAMMEAASVTGPAKNLIGFCQWLQTPEGAQTGIGVSIATFDRNARPDDQESFIGVARAAGIETHVIRERFRFDPGVISQLRKIVAEVDPIILQTHNNKSHLLVRAFEDLRTERRWLAFKHGDVFVDLKQRLYNHVDRLTLRYADRVVSVCRAFTTQLAAHGVDPGRIRVLHNAAADLRVASPSARAQIRAEMGVRDNDRLLLCVGRLSKEKGHADLLRAVSMLDGNGYAWKLVLVGVGPELSQLQSLARALRIDNRTVFAGFRSNVGLLLQAADVFVLPSHSEGSANVLLEAMMARVPIVATDAGGNPEIVLDRQTGIVTPTRDPIALRSGIETILQETAMARNFAQAGLLRAQAEFSRHRYQQRLIDIYKEVTTDCRPPLLSVPQERPEKSVSGP